MVRRLPAGTDGGIGERRPRGLRWNDARRGSAGPARRNGGGCASGNRGVGGELAALTDRLVDNINTLAHVAARANTMSAR